MKSQIKSRLGIIVALFALALAVAFIPIFGNGVNVANASVSNTNEDAKTTIYFTNDIHGNFTHSELKNGMSFATVKALKEKASQGDNKAFAVDAGDMISGTSYANYDKGQHIIEFIKDAGYDFLVPGNHELDYGSEYFLNSISKELQYYACNFYKGSDTQRGDNILPSYKIVDGANGHKIALIGVMTPETLAATAPGYFQDKDGKWVMFIDNKTQPVNNAIYNSVNKAISDAKKECPEAICIGVGHLGNAQSSKLAGIDAASVINNSHGLTAFIDGHSHTVLNETIKDADGNNVIRVQAASGLAQESDEQTGMNRIGELTIDKNGKVSANILEATEGVYDDVTPDASLVQKQNDWISQVKAELGKEISTNKIEFPFDASIQRVKANNLSDLASDAEYYYGNFVPDDNGIVHGCDAAIVNGGTIRKELNTGTNTVLSFQSVMPFLNSFVIAEVTGQQILDALEFSARVNPETNGGFLHPAGMTYCIDTSIKSTVQVKNNIWVGTPTGQYRVNDVKIYDKETQTFKNLDLNKTYKLAGTDYTLLACGDGFAMFRGATIHKDYNNCFCYKVLTKYAQNFKIAQDASLPEITSANSALKKYPEFTNYPINYENKDGAQRIKKDEHNSYVITWVQDDGTLIDKTIVQKGAIPTHADPKKKSTAEYDYTFKKWEPDLAAATQDTTYKASYNAVSKVVPQTDPQQAGSNDNSASGSKTGDYDNMVLVAMLIALGSVGAGVGVRSKMRRK